MNLSMSSQEIIDFLSRSNFARIATIKADCSPHVTPVWYLWENNQLFITIPRGSAKETNIRRNNKVAVTIDTDSTPNRGVIIEGYAEIEELSSEIQRKICQRYIETEDLEKYLEHADTNFDSILLKISPDKVISWDNSRDPFLKKLAYKESKENHLDV